MNEAGLVIICIVHNLCEGCCQSNVERAQLQLNYPSTGKKDANN